MGLYLGGLIIGRIFASEVFFGGGGGGGGEGLIFGFAYLFIYLFIYYYFFFGGGGLITEFYGMYSPPLEYHRARCWGTREELARGEKEKVFFPFPSRELLALPTFPNIKRTHINYIWP